MIHIKRTPKPKSLNSPQINKLKQLLKEFYEKPEFEQSQKTAPFSFDPLRKLINQDLQDLFVGKCAYCESRVSASSPTIIEHFRPKSGTIGLDGKKSHQHYWWLAYEWFNLYLPCQSCNMLKGARFPVEGERAKPGSSEKEVRKENAFLLDPCFDYPEDHLLFDDKGFVASETERGKITIDVINLNRDSLVAERNRVLQQLKTTWNTFTELLRLNKKPNLVAQIKQQLYSPELEYLGMRRCQLQRWSLEAIEEKIASETDLKDFLSFRTVIKQQFLHSKKQMHAGNIKQVSSKTVKIEIDKKVRTFEKEQIAQENYSLTDSSGIENYFRKARLIERIEIHNFKVIENLTLNFQLNTEDEGSWMLLLGENGMGKSSVLQAVALALMGSEARSLIGINDASKYVTYGQTDGFVRVHLTGSSIPIELRFKVSSKEFTTNTQEPKILLLAYGATRLLPRKEAFVIKEAPISRPFNLFNPFIALNDSSAWLYEKYSLDDSRQFDDAAIVIKDLFLLKEDDRLVWADSEPKIQIEGPTFTGRVDLEDLSAGYQSVLAMATDIMSVLSNIWDSMQSAEGIVLIDEIDAHLHPRWKLQIVRRLRRCFPHVQFLVTSHEPLTLRGLSEKEIAVMGRDNEGKIFAQTEDLPNPQALRVDQLLTSEFFGLNSTIDEDLENKFNEYYALLALKKPTKEQKKKISDYKEELDHLNQMGTTQREKMMLEAADRYLANKEHSARKVELKDETRKKILDLWEKI